MKISFVVLTYNRTETLLPVLRSLASQCNADHEVVIADDGSRDDHVEMMQKGCPAFNCPVVHVWHPDSGFTASAARNLGAHFSRGDYIVFLDGDCVPNKSFVAAQTWLAEQGRFVNGSRVLLGEHLTEAVIRGEVDLPSRSAFFWWSKRLRGESNKLLHMARWPWSLFRLKPGFRWRGIRSCNLAVWREDFIAVNGFDETFEGWGHEDADLVLRLSNHGVQRKNGFWATEVYHLWHPENKRDQESDNRQRVVQRMANRQVIAERGLNELGLHSLVKVQQLH